MKKFCLTIAVSLLALVPSEATVIIADPTFLDSDWSHSKVRDTSAGSTASFSVMQQLSGGNPGAYQEGIHQIPGNSILFVSHVLDGIPAYSPAISGLIESLDIAYDFQVTQVTIGSGVSTWFLIEQGGQFYVGPPNGFTLGAGWTAYSADSNLTEDEFSLLDSSGINSAIQPDFSGDPIRLGYVTANSNLAVSSIQTTWGIDNFSVTINNIPEPSRALLLFLGALGVVMRRRA